MTRLIFNRFRLGPSVGEGGMGAVYQATDEETGRQVAVKRIAPALVEWNPDLVERFLLEAKALRLLDHPNIVKVLAAGSEGESYYLIMEFISGGSLRQLIDKQSQLTMNRALEITLELADALARAHHLNVIHRDVKPENILLTDAGIPRLSDFGIAKLGDRDRKVIPSLTRPGMILGSVNYLSPEACYGKALDARADIWALGIVLFEMLAGRPPFTGPTIAATLTAILGQPLPEISGQRRGVPDSVAALLQEMLEKDRDRRIGSARLVAAKLEQILGGHAAADPSTVSMPDTLLQTKLGIPPSRPNLVPRPHLLEALDRAREAKLTLISAPAGFGKTTILTAWARQCDSPIAWLSLSADENDPSRFFLYMVNALKQVFTGIGGASAAMLQSMPPLPVRGALAILINEMSGTEEHGFLLLDDFHLLEDPQISEGLAHLIENMPEWMHIIVSTRSDPPLQLSRLRARGQMLELRQSDLRFSEAEAAVFLNQTIGLRLSEQQIRKLEARTEGWIAGLQLAALSMREKPDLATFVEEFSGSHRFVIDYLADEVLTQQPDWMRLFLQECSVLERFTASLCRMVTGREDAADVLRNLEDSNAFLIPLDDQRHWYRFHPLFRDFLSFQLDGESAAILHRRASEWFLAHDLGAQAVKHAFHSGEGGQVLKAVLATAPAAFRSGSVNLLNGWLTNLPEQTVMEHPDLAIYQGFTLILIGKVRDAHPFLEAADALQTADAPDASQGRLLSLKAHWALFQGELNECVQLSKDALEFLSQDDVVFRNLTLNVLGQVLELKGDVAAAAGVYEQAFRTGWRQHDRVGALVVFTNLIFALNELGRRRDALAWCDQLLEELPSGADSGFSIGDVVHLSRSLLLLEANELKRARQGVARALETLKLANISQGVLWALFIQGRIELAERNYEAAEKIAQEGRQLASQFGIESVHGAWLSGLKAESDLKQGAFAEAEAWSRAEAYSPAETPGHWLEYPYFTFVRLLLAQQRWSDASELIERIEHSANESGRSRKLITVYLLQARIDAARDDPPSARDRIRRAIRIAAAEGYRRAFLDEGPDIAPLLLSVRQEAPSFVDELLAELAPKEEPPKQAVALVEALTDRELEVLRLVVRGMSNREVASVLVVSLGTVKKHLNNIFGKMAVKSRVQASIKARELNLIE